MPVHSLRMPALSAPNPVFVREFRVRMRGARGYALMGGYLLAVLIFPAIYTVVEALGHGAPDTQEEWARYSRAILGGVLEGQTVLATLILPAMLGGVVAMERQRQTYEQLVITPLRASSIMWGKLMAAGARMAYLVFATVPLMAICLWIGGISWDLLAVGSVMCLTTVAFVAAASLCVSALTPTPTSGIVLSYVVVLMASYGIPVVEVLISEVMLHSYGWEPVSLALIPWSATVYYLDASDAGLLGVPERRYWTISLAVGVVSAPVVLALATLGCRSVAAPFSRLGRER